MINGALSRQFVCSLSFSLLYLHSYVYVLNVDSDQQIDEHYCTLYIHIRTVLSVRCFEQLTGRVRIRAFFTITYYPVYSYSHAYNINVHVQYIAY